MAEITSSGGRTSGGTRRRRTSTRIDMTPMVDLAFLLLTFFMLTTTFNKHYAMDLNMPNESERIPAARKTINGKRVLSVVLGERNQIYWYIGVEQPAAVANFASVRGMLLEKNSQIDSMYVMIKPSAKSRYQNVVDILDELLITKIKRYSVVKMTEYDKTLLTTLGAVGSQPLTKGMPQ
jgi:biopolymer transport protein ExbD